jgi:hypothetical protein
LDPDNKFITTYFRNRFMATNNAAYTNLILRLLRDDGGVVYLNGAEVFRSNMTNSGPIAFNTPALSAVGGADETNNFYATNLSPGLLLEGTNLLAVEIHQANPTSSDLSFDLELLGVPALPLPRLAVQRVGGSAVFSWPVSAQGFHLEAAADPGTGGSWAPATNAVTVSNEWLRAGGSLGVGRQFFRLRRP